jgi:predicted GIY-YIG superfamily endonuclease
MIEEKINILDCFDDSIGNLDITKNYIYVLKLVDDRYYVGRTCNILRRIKEHFTEGGAIYTKKYKPLKVIDVEEEKTSDDEKIKTLSIMEKYGWEKVRGACWCCLEIKKPNIEKNKKLKPKKEIKIIPNENDEKIKILYSIENENIIEIGKFLEISPGSVANRLEKLDVIKRRQLARGYFEYIESDLYKENIERRNKEKEYTKIKDNFDINENKNVNLQNIKNMIREKYINAIKL